jgi:hypothetical protein
MSVPADLPSAPVEVPSASDLVEGAEPGWGAWPRLARSADAVAESVPASTTTGTWCYYVRFRVGNLSVPRRFAGCRTSLPSGSASTSHLLPSARRRSSMGAPPKVSARSPRRGSDQLAPIRGKRGSSPAFPRHLDEQDPWPPAGSMDQCPGNRVIALTWPASSGPCRLPSCRSQERHPFRQPT